MNLIKIAKILYSNEYIKNQEKFKYIIYVHAHASKNKNKHIYLKNYCFKHNLLYTSNLGLYVVGRGESSNSRLNLVP
jgi:hypothetical protein